MEIQLEEGKKLVEERKTNAGEWDLFNVLFAAEKMPNALITVMADLSNDCKMLTPEDDDLSFSALCVAFRDLVTRIRSLWPPWRSSIQIFVLDGMSRPTYILKITDKALGKCQRCR